MAEDKKEVEKMTIKEVPTQMGIVFETPEGEELKSVEEVLVWLCNNVLEIKRAVG